MVIEGSFRKSDRSVLVATRDVSEGMNRIKVDDAYYDVGSDTIRRCLISSGQYSIPFHLLRPAVGNR